MNQPKSGLFLRKVVKYPPIEETPFLYEDSAQSSTVLQELIAPVIHPPQRGFASQLPDEICPFVSDPDYAIDPAHLYFLTPQQDYSGHIYGSASYVPSPLVAQEPPSIPIATFLPQILTPDYYNPPENGPSTQAFPVEHARYSQRETLQRVPLSPRHVVISFDNGHNLGLSINLAIDPLSYQRHPSLFTLENCFYPKKKDSRKRMVVHLPSLPPLCLSAAYNFILAPETGLRLKVRIPTPFTTSITHTDGPLGRCLCLEVVLGASTILSTVPTYSSVEVDSDSSKVWLNQQLSAPPAETTIFLGARRSPLAKQRESAVVDSQHAVTKGHEVDASSSPLTPSYADLGPEATQSTGWLDPNGCGNGQIFSSRKMDPYSALEFFPQLMDTEQRRPFGEACANHHPLPSNTSPTLRFSPSLTALGKRRRYEDRPYTWPLPPPPILSPSMDESKYINYHPADEDGDSDTDSDTEDESDDGDPECHINSSTPGQKKTHKHAFMWRKLGVRQIGCSFGWLPWVGVEVLAPCDKIYNRTSNCTGHYKKEHQNADLKWPCGVNICKNQPKQSAGWKGRGKLYYSCEDMGCLAKCDNHCEASFKTSETLNRHQNKHSLDYWLKCQHSDKCSLTFENSDLRSKHHSLCFPGCPNQGNTCTHHRPKPKNLSPKKGQK